MNRLVVAVVVALCLAGCSNSQAPSRSVKAPTASTTAAPPSPAADQRLKEAVKDYSRAFLAGDGSTAYELLSKRCRDAIPLSEFAAITEQAKATYGEVSMTDLRVSVSGSKGSATYTYPVRAINQTDESWVDEGGWKNDDC